MNCISGTLYKYLDNCVTCSGKRLLRRWICHPLKDSEGINSRLNVVDAFAAQPEITVHIMETLSRQADLERLLGRVKSSVHSSISFLLPTIGTRLLRQLVRLLLLNLHNHCRLNCFDNYLVYIMLQIKVFGSLVKGLGNALDLLTLLQEDRKLNLLLSKIFTLPVLEGADGLKKFHAQFDAAMASEFPNYQVIFLFIDFS